MWRKKEVKESSAFDMRGQNIYLQVAEPRRRTSSLDETGKRATNTGAVPSDVIHLNHAFLSQEATGILWVNAAASVPLAVITCRRSAPFSFLASSCSVCSFPLPKAHTAHKPKRGTPTIFLEC